MTKTGINSVGKKRSLYLTEVMHELSHIQFYVEGRANPSSIEMLVNKGYLLRIRGKVLETQKFKDIFKHLVIEQKDEVNKVEDKELTGLALSFWNKAVDQQMFSKKKESLIKFFGSLEMSKMYYIFVSLFPSIGEANKKWNKLFGMDFNKTFRTRYDKVMHRQSFKDFAEDHEPLTIVIATFLYVSSCVSPSGIYITTMKRFIEDKLEDHIEDVDCMKQSDINKLLKRNQAAVGGADDYEIDL